ncbi:MAG: YybS family protein [Synergistaceae bacterium]|jgi:uncharacterized protein YybS (DUF2232 family)|nr:YybS family protein [Synergistaceae bacterium]
MDNRAAFVRCGAGALLSALFFCAGSFSAVLGAVALMLCPAPLAFVGVKDGLYWMSACLAATSAIVLMLFGPEVLVYFFLGEGMLCYGLVLPPMKPLSLSRGSDCLSVCTAVSLLSKLLFLGAAVYITGTNPFTEQIKHFIDIYSTGAAGTDAAKAIEEMAAIVPRMLPSLLVLSSVLDSFVNYKVCERITARGGGKNRVNFPSLPPFTSWRFSKSLVWAFLLAYVLPFLSETGAGDMPADLALLCDIISINLKIIISVLFFIQGMSFVWWALCKKSAHIAIRIMLMALLFFPLFGGWVVALGLCDACFDLRETLSKRKKKQ